MCFPRKPWLGRYNATREEWRTVYRHARIRAKRGLPAALVIHSQIMWKAGRIVDVERKGPTHYTPKENLEFNKLMVELLSELSESPDQPETKAH